MAHILGTTWWTLGIAGGAFVAGALIGPPLWQWAGKFLPWNK